MWRFDTMTSCCWMGMFLDHVKKLLTDLECSVDFFTKKAFQVLDLITHSPKSLDYSSSKIAAGIIFTIFKKDLQIENHMINPIIQLITGFNQTELYSISNWIINYYEEMSMGEIVTKAGGIEDVEYIQFQLLLNEKALKFVCEQIKKGN